MKYIKIFNNESEYNSFKNSEEWVLPNLSLIEETNEIKMSSLIVNNNPSNV